MSRPHADESVFRAIADPTRRRIIELLRARDRTPGDLLTSLPTTFDNLTFHLRVLRSTGLVSQRRAGRERIYRLNATALRAAINWLRPYETATVARTAL